jgi:hypothetical protein
MSAQLGFAPNVSSSSRTDQVGKLFRVVEGGLLRRCLVCEELFTAQEAARHSQLPCRPPLCRAGIHETVLDELAD